MTAGGASRDRDIWFWSAFSLGALFAALSSTLALLRYYRLGNTNADIAFYTRVVWGMAHGDRVNSIIGAHDLGLHFMPGLFLFAPFAYLLPIAETLLVSHALALGAVVPLLFVLGRRMTGRHQIGLALAVAWMLFPSTLQIGSREFHPGTLALPLLVAALDALHAGKNRAVPLLAIACLMREDVALVAAGAGAALMLDPKRRLLGAAIAVTGLVWFSVYILAIQPAFLPPEGSIEAHFSGCGHSAGEVGTYLMTHPLALAERVFGKADLAYMLVLLFSLCGLPLLGARWLLASALPLAINLISDFPASVDVRSHYATLILPGLFMATAVALQRIDAHPARGRLAGRFAMGGLLLACGGGHLAYGATPMSLDWSSDPYRMNRDEGILSWYARAIAPRTELSVSAPAAALNHLAARSRAYLPSFKHPKPDVAILDLTQRQWVQLSPDHWEEPVERQIERLDADPAYGRRRFNPPYRVMWRGLGGGTERLAAVSPKQLPTTATPQHSGWVDAVDLLGLTAHFSKERENFSGEYHPRLVVHMTFYWRAAKSLPPRLLLKVFIKGETKNHLRYFLPTWGMRDTATWKPGEIIRDEQRTVSPGGWPLKALSATVQLIYPNGTPYPKGAAPIKLKWK